MGTLGAATAEDRDRGDDDEGREGDGEHAVDGQEASRLPDPAAGCASPAASWKSTTPMISRRTPSDGGFVQVTPSQERGTCAHLRLTACSTSRSRKGRWPARPSGGPSGSNHSTRSISGKGLLGTGPGRPLHRERPGSNARRVDVALHRPDGHDLARPLGGLTEVEQYAVGRASPSSSSYSRRAASSAASSGPYSPLGIDHAPRSLAAHSGPPMCPSRTSRTLGTTEDQEPCAALDCHGNQSATPSAWSCASQ